MPPRGPNSGIPCQSARGCCGRMEDVLDTEHEDDRIRIVRYRECTTCGARVRTHENPFGPVTEGPPDFYTVKNSQKPQIADNQATLF